MGKTILLQFTLHCGEVAGHEGSVECSARLYWISLQFSPTLWIGVLASLSWQCPLGTERGREECAQVYAACLDLALPAARSSCWH